MVKKRAIECYDFSELTEEVEKKLGRDIHNYAGKKYTGKPDDSPYQNFWHELLDYCGNEISNGVVRSFNFEDMAEQMPEPWQKEIARAYAEVAGPGDHDVSIVW